MYVLIDQMPATSRVWVYQSNRNLNVDEIKLIRENLEQFCDQWAVHGSPMQTSFSVEYNRFIVLAVNEDASSPSGCSIDSSVHTLKTLEQKLGVSFFNRDEIPFYVDGKIVTHPLQDLKKLFADGILHENSTTLNTLVQTLGDWRDKSRVKVSESWLKRYIPKVPVS